jgi:transcriptional regulator with XRE-family HTH domain
MDDTVEHTDSITWSPSERALPAPRRLVAFGLVFKRMRRARRITREQLAIKTGVVPAYIRELEHGRMQPSSSTLMKLAEGLGMSLVVARAFVRVTGGGS